MKRVGEHIEATIESERKTTGISFFRILWRGRWITGDVGNSRRAAAASDPGDDGIFRTCTRRPGGYNRGIKGAPKRRDCANQSGNYAKLQSALFSLANSRFDAAPKSVRRSLPSTPMNRSKTDRPRNGRCKEPPQLKTRIAYFHTVPLLTSFLVS